MSCRLGRGDDTGSTRQGLQEPKIPFRFRFRAFIIDLYRSKLQYDRCR